ncbi:hypothetical protein SAMN05428969_1908 [Devosia sp. YR412]|uniref:hypothetical protein n=1 Tax=Devosia sp. YR412 TaxID=1881030 RepID=UPI0008BFD1DE|nr:hypothetical protein [Devosia sp. YR412]SEQ08930.1 hypothetical protein SAMN05428969_1908 [Devosia sp. YR412]
MNKVVREHYPVEKLPEDLRAEFPNATFVTVEVAVDDEVSFAPPASPMTGPETADYIRKLHAGRTDKGRSMEDIVAEVRQLRDEWDS